MSEAEKAEMATYPFDGRNSYRQAALTVGTAAGAET